MIDTDEILVMTPAEEEWVALGVCPRCLPPEGRPQQMRRLGEAGGLRGWQCERCNRVWMIGASTTTTKSTQNR